MQLWGITLSGETFIEWARAGFIAIGIFFLMLAFRKFSESRLKAFAAKTQTKIDDLLIDLLHKTSMLFFAVIALYAGSLFLAIPDRTAAILRSIVVITIFVQGGILANRSIAFWVTYYVQEQMHQDPSKATSLTAVTFVGKLMIWTAVVLLSLDNMGVQISALLAGIGIGGIAIALAVQNVLKDLFASLSILLDKPFLIGDSITVGDISGTVEHVGLKTTRVRSLSGEQVIFSNTDLLDSRVRNYERMTERRICFNIGVVYSTAPEKLAMIPNLIREIVDRNGAARFERVHFRTFGDSGLIFEIAYYSRNPGFTPSLDVQQAVNLEIVRRFHDEGIDFAYPTQSIYFHGADPRKCG